MRAAEAPVIEAPVRRFADSARHRLYINYLTRTGEEMPANGVPFTAVLTISDPKGEQPVFNDMRPSLNALSVRIEDIRTAARVVTRVQRVPSNSEIRRVVIGLAGNFYCPGLEPGPLLPT